MKFYNVKVGDKLSWVTEGTTWINGQHQLQLLKYPAEVVEVFETTFICRTTDAYYLYRCNKSDGVAVGHGRECGWTEKVKTPSLKEVKPFLKKIKKNEKKPCEKNPSRLYI